MDVTNAGSVENPRTSDQTQVGNGSQHTWLCKAPHGDCELKVDLAGKKVTVDGVSVRLTIAEYRILELLISKQGTVCTKEIIFDTLYKPLFFLHEPNQKVIDVFICHLNSKLGNQRQSFVKTMWGRGYYIERSIEMSQNRKPAASSPSALQEKKRPVHVAGLDGSVLTLTDLPSRTRRWVIRRKAEVVCAVRGGLLSMDEALELYMLTPEEFLSWEKLVKMFGLPGLRITRFKQYR